MLSNRALDGLDFTNTIVAGGSVLTALHPSEREPVCCGSVMFNASVVDGLLHGDIDLFIFGIGSSRAALVKTLSIIQTVSVNCRQELSETPILARVLHRQTPQLQ